MKAAVYERYGSPEVVQLRDVPQPEPKDEEVLLRVHATTVTSGDARLRALNVPRGFAVPTRLIFGISAPRQQILGMEAAGVIERVGRAVTRFAVGDEVIAFAGASLGCHAQYRCIEQSAALVHKPSALTWNEAAAFSFGGTTALEYLRRAQVQPGQRVLINGASGAVGSAAVQLAVQLGAVVTGVCSAANHALVRSLGAADIIDYQQQDFTVGSERYDVIIDTIGCVTYARVRSVLTEAGRLGLVAADMPAMLQGAWANVKSKQRVLMGPAPERAEDLAALAQLFEQGSYKPVIDRCVAFEQIVDAHRLVDSGRKRGNVVVTLLESSPVT